MLLASAFKFMATFRFEFTFYINCTLMATFYTHGYTHSYLLLSWPHSGLHFMRTATLKVTFKTHGYTNGYILRSWLHFTPGYTYGYMRLHFRPFLLSNWRRGLHAYAHLCLRSWSHYAHGYTECYILHSWLYSPMGTFCTHGGRYSYFNNYFYSIPFT